MNEQRQMKGQIPVLEMIAVTVILFISFTIFFPTTSYGNRWDDADITLKGRDMVLTIDRTGNIGNYTSNPSLLTEFLNKTLPEKNLLYWSTIEGTVLSKVTVACNCTTDQIDWLTQYMGRMKINGRDIQVDFIKSTLSPIQDSDVLIIWGETNLAPYESSLLEYLSRGDGIVGISDIVSPDITYRKIFGVSACTSILGSCMDGGSARIDLTVPTNSTEPTYQIYKLFYHMPIRSLATNLWQGNPPFPTENVTACSSFDALQGTLGFKQTNSRYWICNKEVYIDTNGNGVADVKINETEKFNVTDPAGRFNFVLSYSDLNRTYVSFKPPFFFDDSQFKSPSVLLYPSDMDVKKIVAYDGYYQGGTNPIPVIVANTSTAGKVFWTSDFLTLGNSTKHDKRLLMASVVLAASNKKSGEQVLGGLQVSGVTTPYINVVNRDMLEIYQFNLGLGYPF